MGSLPKTRQGCNKVKVVVASTGDTTGGFFVLDRLPRVFLRAPRWVSSLHVSITTSALHGLAVSPAHQGVWQIASLPCAMLAAAPGRAVIPVHRAGIASCSSRLSTMDDDSKLQYGSIRNATASIAERPRTYSIGTL